MAEPKITPLARRLAEENGIDWRRLQGTGPEGTIVERDILAFLAKVMAGEVDLPPMPEEAPPLPPECLLHTSDAADDPPCVDPRGHRITQQKTLHSYKFCHPHDKITNTTSPHPPH
ncbi:E3 binding domain-containing protein, partial [Thermus scotoductus]|uniref:E3 binding domain-containing protein n=1 Tax=Thermus scotoductus TaxID=37636 RepID=UPI0020A40768